MYIFKLIQINIKDIDKIKSLYEKVKQYYVFYGFIILVKRYDIILR